jgi:tryptophan 2,3-dioxygenase
MERILKIQSVLISQVSVIETMTPADFLEFRAHLTPASGFQSWQFRLIENKTGLNSERTFKNKPVYEHLKADHRDQVRATAADATLLELVEEWLERCPFINFGDFRFWQAYQTAAEKMLAEDEHTIKNNVLLGPEQKERELKDLETTRQSFASIFDREVHEQLRAQGRRRLSHEATLAALFINLYREYPLLQLPFRLLTALCDMDENWSLWRYRHACMAQRMIGTKIGTGGSAGHAYLHKTVRSTEYRAFVDLENISTYLLPSSARPVLPPALVHALQFAHTASSKSFAELAGLSQ